MERNFPKPEQLSKLVLHRLRRGRETFGGSEGTKRFPGQLSLPAEVQALSKVTFKRSGHCRTDRPNQGGNQVRRKGGQK